MIASHIPSLGAPIGLAELVRLAAALIAVGALGIDAMLPALPVIGEALDVADANRRRFVVFGGFRGGATRQRGARRPVRATDPLAWALAGCAVADIAAVLAGRFAALLAAGIVAGVLTSATRVATVTMVRDCYHKRAMTGVMTMAIVVFMLVPILASAFGQAVLPLGDWRLI